MSSRKCGALSGTQVCGPRVKHGATEGRAKYHLHFWSKMIQYYLVYVFNH